MKYLKNSKIFCFLILILSLGLVITVYNNIAFVFSPLVALFNAVFLPVILAVFIYYLFLPVHRFIRRRIHHQSIHLLFTIIVIVISFALLILLVGPSLVRQAQSFISLVPSFLYEAYYMADDLLLELGITLADIYEMFEHIDLSISNLMATSINAITNSLGAILSNTITFLITLFTFPLILFYLFKDGAKFKENIIKIVPRKYEQLTDQLIQVIHESSSNYIGSRMLIVLYVAVASFILYWTLGLENPLFLGIFNGLFDIIPYFGPWIGAAPAFFAILLESPVKAIILVVVIMIIQQVESSVVTPMVMGYGMKVHPVTTVILILFAGEFAGILGMIFVLPIYAISKNIVITLIHYIREHSDPDFLRR